MMKPALFSQMLGGAVFLATVPAAVTAADYPSRPIRVVVPFSPGGNVDVTARILSGPLSDALGQTIVVDNRTGAGGAIGGDIVAKSVPDGYTILMGSSGLLTAGVAVRSKMPYDPVKDFSPIALLQTVPLVLIASPKSTARNLQDLIAMARERPGQITMASGDIGSSNHLGVLLINTMAKVKFLPVIYKGGGQSLPELMGGQIETQMSQPTSAINLIRDGRVKGIAVTSLKRSSAMPAVPTVDESGLKGFEAITMLGALAPARTPPAIVSQLAAAFAKVMGNAAVRAKFENIGADPAESSPKQFADFIRNDLDKWRKVVAEAGLKVE